MSCDELALPFTKLCDVEDFVHPALAPVIRDVCSHKRSQFGPDFPRGAEHRKDWEVAMAVRALRQFGALRPDAVVLGVAAGTEDTIFYLSKHVRQVFATDRYLSSGPWQPVAPLSMLVDPSLVAPTDFDPERLVVQHMDGRRLLYPPDTFDGIFSSGSIEHFGDLYDVAAAAYEMGRVLRPGGVLSLSTEFRLAGPPGGIGWPGSTLLFSPEDLQRYIVEASGLEPVGELATDVSDATLSTPRDITRVINDRRARQPGGPRAPLSDATTWDDRPHIVLLHDGYVFTSVHLTLRKTGAYPSPPNDWARPSAAVLQAIAIESRQLLERSARPAPAADTRAAAANAKQPAATGPQQLLRSGLTATESGCHAADRRAASLGVRFEEVENGLHDIDVARHEVDTRLARVDVLARQAELRHKPSTGPAPTPPPAGCVCTSVTVASGVQFSVVTDPAVPDPVAAGLRTGRSNDDELVRLMLDIVQPGDRMVDLGAHVGTFALAAAAAGVHALAVEAAPRNVALLRESVKRNSYSNVRVIHAAVSDEPGSVEFVDNGPWGRVANGDEEEQTVSVPAVTLTELLAELRWWPLAFVKMDVEGSEIAAIKGMRYFLEADDAPPVLYESNGHTLELKGATPEDLVGQFESLGYSSYLVDQGRLVRVTAARMQPQTIVDYLAVKRLPRGIRHWRVEPELTTRERVSRLLADAGHPNPDHRAYVARALERTDDDVLSDSSIASCRERLAGEFGGGGRP